MLCASQNFFKIAILDSLSDSSWVSISLKFVSFVASPNLQDPCVDVSPSKEVSMLIFFVDWSAHLHEEFGWTG